MYRYLIIALFAAVGTVVSTTAYTKSAKEVFAEVSGGIVVVLAMNARGADIAQGSGVVVGTNEVVTNCHVVSGATEIVVRQAADARSRETYRMAAKLTAQNETRDLCVLFVDELSIPPAAKPVPLGVARNVSIGEEVYAIGAPRGLELSLSRGIISQLRGEGGKRAAPILQTDAAISPGSSGGGLFDQDGKLIGITTFKALGTGTEGLSFAIPVEWVVELTASFEPRRSDEQRRIALLERKLEEKSIDYAEVYALYIVAQDSLAESELALRENHEIVAQQRNQITLLNQRIAVLQEHFTRIEETTRFLSHENPKKELIATAEDPEVRLAELGTLYVAAQISLAGSEDALSQNLALSARQRDQIAVLNQQIDALMAQLGRVEQALQISERDSQEQQVTIANLGQRLNMALAAKVEELAAYRSEFFGRLREVLSERRDFTIIGDRFVFQSEVLFASASDELGPEGHERLAQFTQVLKEVMVRIPPDLPWILQVDGHTDSRPIKTARFPSNWELSAARAISVVNFLIALGIQPEHLSATGYGEFQPLDDRDDEIAHRRNRRIELKLSQR